MIPTWLLIFIIIVGIIFLLVLFSFVFGLGYLFNSPMFDINNTCEVMDCRNYSRGHKIRFFVVKGNPGNIGGVFKKKSKREGNVVLIEKKKGILGMFGGKPIEVRDDIFVLSKHFAILGYTDFIEKGKEIVDKLRGEVKRWKNKAAVLKHDNNLLLRDVQRMKELAMSDASKIVKAGNPFIFDKSKKSGGNR